MKKKTQKKTILNNILMPPKTKPEPFITAKALEDIKIGSYPFRKDQEVFLKRVPNSYQKDKVIYSTVDTLIFIGIGGGTGKGTDRIDKYNKWYSLSKSEEKNFSLTQLL